MKKTLYVRDEDEAIWDRARELFGEKLSPIIAQQLKTAIRDREREVAKAEDLERIVLQYRDSENGNLPTAKAFHGKWAIGPDKPYEQSSEEGDHQWYYQVAVTQKGKVAIFKWETWQEDGNNHKGKYAFRVFDSFAQASADGDMGPAARKAYETLGVPVEELDI